MIESEWLTVTSRRFIEPRWNSAIIIIIDSRNEFNIFEGLSERRELLPTRTVMNSQLSWVVCRQKPDGGQPTCKSDHPAKERDKYRGR